VTGTRRMARSIFLPSGRAIGRGEEVTVVGRYSEGIVLARLPVGNRETFEKIPEDALEPADQGDIFGGDNG
jgi:hypothetical protein